MAKARSAPKTQIIVAPVGESKQATASNGNVISIDGFKTGCHQANFSYLVLDLAQEKRLIRGSNGPGTEGLFAHDVPCGPGYTLSMPPSYATGLAALKRRRNNHADQDDAPETDAELREAVLEGPFAQLVDRALISETDLLKVEVSACALKIDVVSILMQQHGILREVLRECLMSHYNLPFIEFSTDVHISRDLVDKLNPRYLKRVGWVPLPPDGDPVSILIDNPRNAWKCHDIQMLFRDRQIRYFLGFREDIVRFIDSAFGIMKPEKDISAIMSDLGGACAAPPGSEEDGMEDAITESDSAIIQLVNQVIIDAHKQGASDIHIEPNSHDKETMVRFRVDGHCRTYQKMPGSYRRPLAARIKIMAGLDISERRKPQDGKIVFRFSGKKIELRVATIPTSGTGNEDIVLRLLASGEPLPLERLNLSKRNHDQLKALLDKPYGLILCVGPTGSGKTTTLHSALKYLNRPEKKIWTAEDPVEITQVGLRQVPVQNKIGLNFPALLRSFLRADPDIIMIGEMRDSETIEIGLKASLTGHLVLSTLHTNSAPETVSRLLDMGVDPFSFGDALLGVIGQRLIRTLCKLCRQPYEAMPREQEQVRKAYGEKAFASLERPEGMQLYRAKGCVGCGGSGYKGRTGIHELLVVSNEIRKLIHARAQISEIQRVAMAQGMTTLCQDGLIKYLLGQTDLQQVIGSVKTG